MRYVIILSILSIFLSFPYWKKQWSVRLWRKKLDLDKNFMIWQKNFYHINGFQLSKSSRQQGDAFEYVYGEITFFSFVALLSLTKPNNKTIFYDLGSGVGKAVLACAMVFKVKKSCGIELFIDLHTAALSVQKVMINEGHHEVNSVEFIHDNFMTANFADASLIFINATGFFGETWQKINQRLTEISSSATIITTTKKLSSPAFIHTHTTFVEMSWGIVQAFIHEPKLNDIQTDN
ncbi:MAG: hypothetical protein ACOVQX_06080 [Legionella sp.]